MAKRKSANSTIHLDEAPKNAPFRLKQADLLTFNPLTENQREFFESYSAGDYFIMLTGSAGTGKSFCAAYLALTDVLRGDTPQQEIIIVRSAVSTREIGHLPGEISDKLAPYEEPYRDIFATLLRKGDAYDTMKESGKLRFMATSFVRGLTWNNAVVIIDEAQSMTFHELNSVITRLGDNSRLILCGDIAQNDLVVRRNDQSGFMRALTALGRMKSIDTVQFTREDIVRSAFVKEWICAVEDTPE